MSDTHTGVDPGVRGQTRTTWRNETTLRGVLFRLIKEHPRASKATLKDLYLAKIERRPDLIEEAKVRAFDNDWKNIHDPPRKRAAVDYDTDTVEDDPAEPKPHRVRSRPTPAEAAAKEAEIAAAVEQIKTVVMLDLIQPNGKKLRDCTAAEVIRFGGRYVKVGERLGGGKVLIGTLSEAQVNKILTGTR